MNTRKLTPEERFDLIMECRSSGLTDYQWCTEHNIHPSTFYNWITRFRKKGYPNIDNIPAATKKISKHRAVKQEVVKLEILPESTNRKETIVPSSSTSNQFVYGGVNDNYSEPVMEICANGAVIRITNQINPALLNVVLNQLGGTR